jgi:hypothetical protein
MGRRVPAGIVTSLTAPAAALLVSVAPNVATAAPFGSPAVSAAAALTVPVLAATVAPRVHAAPATPIVMIAVMSSRMMLEQPPFCSAANGSPSVELAVT